MTVQQHFILAATFVNRFLCSAEAAVTNVTYNAAGTGAASTPITAKVNFIPGGNAGCATPGTLCITLTNTTLTGTLNRSDVLSGVYFSMVTAPQQSLAVTHAYGNTVNPPQTNYDAAFAVMGRGGWDALYSSTGLTSQLPWQYGISTAGNGVFPGNKVGSDDYSIIAANSTLNLNTTPMIQTSLSIIVTGFTLTDLTKINSVGVSWGSAPSAVTTATVQAAENPTAFLALLGISLIGLARFRFSVTASNIGVSQ